MRCAALKYYTQIHVSLQPERATESRVACRVIKIALYCKEFLFMNNAAWLTACQPVGAVESDQTPRLTACLLLQPVCVSTRTRRWWKRVESRSHLQSAQCQLQTALHHQTAVRPLTTDLCSGAKLLFFFCSALTFTLLVCSKPDVGVGRQYKQCCPHQSRGAEEQWSTGVILSSVNCNQCIRNG